MTSLKLFRGFVVGALAIPMAFLLGLFFPPGGGWIAAILATAFVSLPALGLLVGARDGRSRHRVQLLITALTGIGGLAILLGFALATDKDPGAYLASQWVRLIPEQIAAYKKSGWSESSLAGIGKLYELFRFLLAEHLPGLVLSLSVLYAAVVVYPVASLMGLVSGQMTDLSFSQFTTPTEAAVLFVPAGLAAAIGPPGWSRPAVDLLLPLSVLYFLRGLAIIRVLLDRGRAGLIGRTLVYTLLFQMPFPLILALGGLFDEFLNFRARLARADARRESGEP